MVVARMSIEPRTVVPYQDLREFVEIVDALGELRRANGADQRLEIGAISALSRESRTIPTVLCDQIPGLDPGFRILLNPLHSYQRVALTVGLPLGLSRAEYGKLGPSKWRDLTPIPHRIVQSGPVLENRQDGQAVDLTRFPRPFWHEDDGGAYIGTADAVVTRDPDDGWVNVGTYRVMYQDPTHVAVMMDVSHQGRLHQNRYFKQGRPCPIAISLGHDPLLFIMASHTFPEGVCEYDYVGGVRGEPMEAIIEPHTGLPIPARAELVLAGEVLPDDIRPEGPFGEWTGYYGGGIKALPTVTVRAVYYRNNPIMLGNMPGRPPHQPSANTFLSILHGDGLADRLRRSVPGVKDAVSIRATGGLMTVVSIQQQYPGHAKQAGLALVNGGGHRPRYAIVVDEDINIRDTDEVLWAICTRSDPSRDFEVVTRMESTQLDPLVRAEEEPFMSRAVIDATRPYHWIDEFPKAVSVSPDLRRRVQEKWASLIE